MAANQEASSSASRVPTEVVPLKSMCSRKCAIPVFPGASSTPPTRYSPTKDTVGTAGRGTMRSLIPFTRGCSIDPGTWGISASQRRSRRDLAGSSLGGHPPTIPAFPQQRQEGGIGAGEGSRGRGTLGIIQRGGGCGLRVDSGGTRRWIDWTGPPFHSGAASGGRDGRPDHIPSQNGAPNDPSPPLASRYPAGLGAPWPRWRPEDPPERSVEPPHLSSVHR